MSRTRRINWFSIVSCNTVETLFANVFSKIPFHASLFFSNICSDRLKNDKVKLYRTTPSITNHNNVCDLINNIENRSSRLSIVYAVVSLYSVQPILYHHEPAMILKIIP